MTRWWLIAVVWSRSTASVATARAESKPKVTSVAPRSLSIVLGTPIIRIPRPERSRAIERLPSPPTTIRTWRPWRWAFLIAWSERSRKTFSPFSIDGHAERVVPVAAAEDRSAAGEDAAHVGGGQRAHPIVG